MLRTSFAPAKKKLSGGVGWGVGCGGLNVNYQKISIFFARTQGTKTNQYAFSLLSNTNITNNSTFVRYYFELSLIHLISILSFNKRGGWAGTSYQIPPAVPNYKLEQLQVFTVKNKIVTIQ